MLCLSGFELYSRWVPLLIVALQVIYQVLMNFLPFIYSDFVE